MKVKDIMTRDVQVCTPETNLAAAAMIMWENDCGCVPVMNPDDCRVIGVITDRDICIAVATKDRKASDISVSDVLSGKLYACNPEDNIRDALKRMRAEKIRRLPVISTNGTLEGIVSINDVVLHAEEDRGSTIPGLSYADVVQSLKDICAHRRGVTTSVVQQGAAERVPCAV